MVTDDAFAAFAEQIEREELQKQERRSGGSFNFEKQKWTGIPKKGAVVIRALGEAPNSGASKFTSRTYRFSKIKGDNGKEMHVRLPLLKDEPEHIMWKIINKVLTVDYKDNVKYFVYEKASPEMFNMVRYNGLPANSERRMYEKGWSGQDMFVMNCLDRNPDVYAWSRENKHSVLLSKDVNIVTDKLTGKTMEFIAPGVPSFGFVNALAHNLFKYYGDWKNYDIKIEKTGQNTAPYAVANASEHLQEVPALLKPFVVKGDLTEEELSWEMYDLDKLFAVTSYTKLFNRLQKSISSIDLVLGTHYFEELKSLAEEEEKNKKSDSPATVEDESDFEEEKVKPLTVTTDVPVRAKRQEAVGIAPVVVNPKGYDKLSAEEKKMIVAMTNVSGDTWDILYEGTGSAKIVACSICKTPSPDSFATCPGCAALF